jgi:hypothetical protein
MHLVTDNATRAAALKTIRELLASGLAGNDCYDHDVFVVDAPTRELRDHAEVALDVLGAAFLKDNRASIRCELPRWVRAELGLDGPDAPELIVPLASRALPVSRAECEVEIRRAYPGQTADLILGAVFGPSGLDADGEVGVVAREALERTDR